MASVVAFKHGRPNRANYRRMKMKTVEGQNDFACIAEAVRRRYSRLLREAKGEKDEEADRPIVEELRTLMHNPGEAMPSLAETEEAPRPASAGPAKPATRRPDLIVIDGGKGQLNAACAELEKLGLSNIPIIGLAKEFEYRPEGPKRTHAPQPRE